MTGRLRLSATMLALVLFGAGSARANFLVNGDFEQPALGPGTDFITVGGSALPGWTVNAGRNVDLIRAYWPAFQGNQSLDLVGNSGPGTSIAQSFATTPGLTYIVSFAFANNVDTSFATGQVEVLGATTLINETLTHSGSTRAAMNYSPYSRTFVANSTTTTLRFTHVTSSIPQFSGLALDDVSVTVVPEPTTLTTACLGLLALGGYAWRRRKQAA